MRCSSLFCMSPETAPIDYEIVHCSVYPRNPIPLITLWLTILHKSREAVPPKCFVVHCSAYIPCIAVRSQPHLRSPRPMESIYQCRLALFTIPFTFSITLCDVRWACAHTKEGPSRLFLEPPLEIRSTKMFFPCFRRRVG